MATHEAPAVPPTSTANDDALLSRLISHIQGGDAEPPPALDQRLEAPAPVAPVAPPAKGSDQDIEVDGDWKPEAPMATPLPASLPTAAAAAATPAAAAAPVVGGIALSTPGTGMLGGDPSTPLGMMTARSDPVTEAADSGKKLSRRIIANRESAQRSRLRKLQYIADLEANIAGLNGQVTKLGPQLAFLRSQHESFERQNDELRAQVAQLLQETQYKDNLNDVLRTELARLQGKDVKVEERPSLLTQLLPVSSAISGGISISAPGISVPLPLSAQLALGTNTPYPTLPVAPSSIAAPAVPVPNNTVSANTGSVLDPAAFPHTNLTPAHFSELQSAIASGNLSADLFAALTKQLSPPVCAPPHQTPALLPQHGGSSVLAAAQAAFLAASAATASLPFQAQQLPPSQPALDTVPMPLLHVSSQQHHTPQQHQQQARGVSLGQQLPLSTWQQPLALQQPQVTQQPQPARVQQQLSAQDLLQRLQGNIPAPIAAPATGGLPAVDVSTPVGTVDGRP